jgi:zona occludens toxin (predicted ATPase)
MGVVTKRSTSSALRPVPLGNDDNLGIGNIGKGFNGHIFETYKSRNRQNRYPNKGKCFIFNEKAIIFLMNLFMIDFLT